MISQIFVDFQISFWGCSPRERSILKNEISEGLFRNSLLEVGVFLGKMVLKICRKFTEEHPCQILISVDKVAALLKLHFGMGFL